MTDMANNFYYCGKLSLKLLIFKLTITYFWNTQNAPDCTIFYFKKSREHALRPPSPNLNPHHYRAIFAPSWYVIFDVKKGKLPFFTFLWLRGAIAPQTPLLNVNVFIFCTNGRSGFLWHKIYYPIFFLFLG